MSHVEYATDRSAWLLGHADLIGGLKFYEEPPVLRFFAGRMEALGGWGAKLVDAFEKDFGPNC
jgi:tyrosine phenol-lyase